MKIKEQWRKLRKASSAVGPVPAAVGAMPLRKAGPMPCPHAGEEQPPAPAGK